MSLTKVFWSMIDTQSETATNIASVASPWYVVDGSTSVTPT